MVDAIEADGSSISHRVQRLCKDMKLIDILGDILYYTF